METLKTLNDLRIKLKVKEKELEQEVYFLGKIDKGETLKKCKKNRRKTEKMIFAIIQKS